MLLILLFTGASATPSIFAGTVQQNSEGLCIKGGTPLSVTITTAQELQAINTDLSGHYILGNDIDCSETFTWNDGKGFDPIGNQTHPFTGILDGANYTISNLFINRTTNYVGLFGYADGVNIMNVGLINATIKGNQRVGGLIGHKYVGTVCNSYNTGSVTGTGDSVGGLIGQQSGGNVSYCYASSSVKGNTRVGGLVGSVMIDGNVSNSYAIGNVTGNNRVGGLVGWKIGGSSSVSDSYATGDVIGNQRVGGLIGYQYSGTVSYCYASGSVTGTGRNSGGLIGESRSTVSDSYATGTVTSKDLNVGGLIGYQYSGTVSYCYASGSVTGTSWNSGGLIGFQWGSSVSNSYATGTVTGTDGVGGLIGLQWSSSVSNSYATGSIAGTGNYVGGFLGTLSGTVSNCYATGNVTRLVGTNQMFGGFVGYNAQGKIFNSYSIGAVYESPDILWSDGSKGFAGEVGIDGDYEMTGNFWDTQKSGQSSTAGNATGKTTVEMKTKETYVSWDIFYADEIFNDGYPFFSWQSPKSDGSSVWLLNPPVEIPPESLFVSIWNTTKTSSGSSASNQIKLPLTADGIYDFIVDWGDGTSDHITTWNQPTVTHTYNSPGIYTINITGIINGWRFNNNGDRLKLLDIQNWGTLQLGDGGRFFAGASNMIITANDTLDLTGITSLSNAFAYASSLTTVPGMELWDTSAVVDMSFIFSGAEHFNHPIGTWDTSNVQTMRAMFQNAKQFNQPLNTWDVSSVEQMEFMFKGAAAFNQPLESWDTGAVNRMDWMFMDAAAFNQSLNSWDVSQVTVMNHMFYRAVAFNQPLDMWNTSSVGVMAQMFQFASSFNQDISFWDVSSVNHMASMFNQAVSFDQDLGSWDVSNVGSMSTMFSGVTLSVDNYDNILIGWSQQDLKDNVVFGAGDSQYSAAPCPGGIARQHIIDTFNWVISDGGSIPCIMPPSHPSNPVPDNNATNINIDANLGWTCDPLNNESLLFDVYFGETNPPTIKVSANQTMYVYDPGVMSYSTLYYWRIVVWNEYNLSTIGPVWSFTTQASPGGPGGPGSPGGTPSISPTADAGGPYMGFVDEEIQLNGAATEGTPPFQYDWKFYEEDTWRNDIGPTPTTIYTQPGTYTITLRVTNNIGTSTNTTTITILTGNLPPTQPIVTGPTNGTTNTTYEFTAVSTDPDNDHIQYIFNWDDGQTITTNFYPSGTTITINHTWTNPGEYQITITAFDNQTISPSTQHTITIEVEESEEDEEQPITMLLYVCILLLIAVLLVFILFIVKIKKIGSLKSSKK